MFFQGALMSKKTAWLLSVLAFLLFSFALFSPHNNDHLLAAKFAVTENGALENSALQKLELGDSHIVVTMGHLDIVKDTPTI